MAVDHGGGQLLADQGGLHLRAVVDPADAEGSLKIEQVAHGAVGMLVARGVSRGHRIQHPLQNRQAILGVELAAPGGGIDPTTGDLIAPAGRPELQYQPVSSVFMCEPGEKVLLRFANLGYTYQSMTVSGLRLRVIAKDATLLRGLTAGGRTGADLSFETNTISIGPGEGVEAIFSAPSTPGTYLLYNRNSQQQSNAGGPGYGGQMAQIVVVPAGTLLPQDEPHTNPLA